MRWYFRRGLRVLMYHRTSRTFADEHTVNVAQLERQLRWLRDEGFRFVSVADILRGDLNGDEVLVTFDDAYTDTLDVAAPVLGALEVPAVVFVPTAFIGQTSAWDVVAHPLMDRAALCRWADHGFELGLHSHRHENFAKLTSTQVSEDVQASLAVLRSLGVSVVPALAYPYGGRPKNWRALWSMQEALVACGLALAFRVGNRINELPLVNRLELQRLSVRGDESFGAFQRKVAWGRFF